MKCRIYVKGTKAAFAILVAVVTCVSVGASYFVLSTLSERDGYSGGYEYSMSGTYDSEGVSGLDAYGTAVLEFKEESDLYRVYRIDFFLSYGNSDGSVSGDMEPFGTGIFFGRDGVPVGLDHVGRDDVPDGETGTVSTDVYVSSDGTYQYTFHVGEKCRIWKVSVQTSDQAYSETGTRLPVSGT